MYHSRILKVMDYLLPPWEQGKGEYGPEKLHEKKGATKPRD